MKKKFDNLGRICIPKHIREDLALDENSYLSIEYDKNQKQITLKKTEQTCAVCSSADDLLQIERLCLCKKCLRKFIEQA